MCLCVIHALVYDIKSPRMSLPPDITCAYVYIAIINIADLRNHMRNATTTTQLIYNLYFGLLRKREREK